MRSHVSALITFLAMVTTLIQAPQPLPRDGARMHVTIVIGLRG